MLDIKRIKENPEAVKAGLRAKEVDCDAQVDRILELDAKRRALILSTETDKAEQNRVSKEIPMKKKAGEDVAPIFKRMAELKAAIALALENDRKVVFEAFVDGQEVECAVIGSDPAVATRPGEILAGAEFYTYDDKYKNGVSQTVIPAHLPEAKLDEVKTYAAMAYTALNCEGLARCDFFVEKNTGRVLINEINTFPGFTAISMYPKLMEHEGLPVPQLIDRLIALAVERTEKQHG